VFAARYGLNLHVMYIQSPVVTIFTARFNSAIQRSAHTVYLCVFCGYEKNSDYFPIHHLLTGFHNRDGECLLHGTMSCRLL
jgi:hypothetical protein